MNTYLFQNDNTILLTESTSGIVEKSNSIDALRIIVPKLYDETYEMATFDGILEYILPISKSNGMYQLTLADENYKEDYLLYTLPEGTMTTALTAEVGEVQFSLHFVKAELDQDGNTIERVRQSVAPAILKILPVASWLSPSDAALTSIASLYLENKKAILALAELANIINTSKGDDLHLNIEDGKIKLTANGTEIGDGISIEALNQELVLAGGSSPDNGNISIQQI